MTQSAYPSLRMRRTRTHGWSRAMVRETTLSPADLIWPLFVTDGVGVEEPIAALPGVSRWSVDLIAERAGEAMALGIPCLALFPNTQAGRRSEDGAEALNPDNLMCRATRAIRDMCGDGIGVLTDVALDPYTSHGQDGLIDASGYILNDDTLEVLVQQALAQAAAGVDIVAPSDMMDGRIGRIREALERERHIHTLILAYSAKYASAFYGPFRDAVGSASNLGKGDKKTYQMDPGNSDEAMREIALDLAEGADMIMVKPGMPYLDILADLSRQFPQPWAVYEVSGEYASIELLAQQGLTNRINAHREAWTALVRAGASMIISYGARHAREWLAA